MGPGSPVENDFALGLTYSPVCVGLDRVEAGHGHPGRLRDVAGGRGGGRCGPSGRRAVLVRRRRAVRGRALARAGRGAACRRRRRLELGRRGVSGAGACVAFPPLRRGSRGEVRPGARRRAAVARCGRGLGGRLALSGASGSRRRGRAGLRCGLPGGRRAARGAGRGVPPALRARSARVWTSGGGTACGSPFVGHGPCWARASGAGTWSARVSRGRSGRSSGSEAGGCRSPSSGSGWPRCFVSVASRGRRTAGPCSRR